MSLLLAMASPAPAQPYPWSLQLVSERAAVALSGSDATWSANRLQAAWVRPETGGWFVEIQHERRFGGADVALSTRGYRRLGDWTVLFGAGVSPGAEFLYRGAVETELSRRLAGSVVGSIGYRYLTFRATDVHQVQPALTWYHARGEVQGRVFATRNTAARRTARTYMLAAAYDVTPRLRLAGGLARGQRIFDVAALAAPDARASVGYANARIGVTAHDFLIAGFTGATEEPAFEYRSITLGYRRIF